MGCYEIAENANYSTELLREIKAQSTRYFILLVTVSILCGMLVAYIFYDRHLDSEFEIDATATEIIQDGEGYNSYVDGIGDIINGAESEKDND